MNKHFFYALIVLAVAFTTACQPKIDSTSEQTLEESVDKIKAKLDSASQQKFAESIFTIGMLEGQIPNTVIHGLLGEENVEDEIESLFKELNGMTYEDVVKFADELIIEKDKLDMNKLYEKKAKQAEYDKEGCKLSFTPTKIYKNPEGIETWLYYDYEFVNNYNVDVVNVRYLQQYVSGTDTITNENFINKGFKKGETGTDDSFFSNDEFINITDPELGSFTFVPVAVYIGDVSDEGSVIYNKNYFTEKDQEQLTALEAAYPDLKH